MSVAALIGPNGKILSDYLPTVTGTPTLAQVLTSGDDADGQNIMNVTRVQFTNPAGTIASIECGGSPASDLLVNAQNEIVFMASQVRVTSSESYSVPGEVVFTAATGITTQTGANDQLSLIATGTAQVVVSDKVNNGRVYDSYFNPVFRAKGIGQLTPVGGGVYQATISVTGLLQSDLIFITPLNNLTMPQGVLSAVNNMPSNATFTVSTSSASDTYVKFSWMIVPA
jgi:hypothetical protein